VPMWALSFGDASSPFQSETQDSHDEDLWGSEARHVVAFDEAKVAEAGDVLLGFLLRSDNMFGM
jgi:hypothetical protein